MHDLTNDKFYCKYHSVSYAEGEKCPVCYPNHVPSRIKKERDDKIFKLNSILFALMALEMYLIIAALGGSSISAIIAVIMTVAIPYIQGRAYQRIEKWSKNA